MKHLRLCHWIIFPVALWCALAISAAPTTSPPCTPESLNSAVDGRGLVDDKAITDLVHRRLLNEPFLGEALLGVETLAGTVWLSGYVEREEDRSRAIEITWSIEGVHGVRSDICVLNVEPGCLLEPLHSEDAFGFDPLPGV